MVEGSKARSKRNKTRARRRARMEIRRGLEGALEKNSKGGRIGNALPQEWKLKGGGKIERFFQVV